MGYSPFSLSVGYFLYDREKVAVEQKYVNLYLCITILHKDIY